MHYLSVLKSDAELSLGAFEVKGYKSVKVPASSVEIALSLNITAIIDVLVPTLVITTKSERVGREERNILMHDNDKSLYDKWA